jgi:hypothetical protein
MISLDTLPALYVRVMWNASERPPKRLRRPSAKETLLKPRVKKEVYAFGQRKRLREL